jgi:hypothetical protein
VAGAGAAGFLDPVRVVAGALDDARVGPVPAAGLRFFVRVMLVLAAQGGKAAGSAARRRTIRTVRLNLTQSGSVALLFAVRLNLRERHREIRPLLFLRARSRRAARR